MGINKRLLIPQDSGVVNTENFAPVLYSGNGSTRSINVGFAADLVLIKNRTVGQGWSVWDTVRGASSGYLQTEATSAQAPQQNMLTFDSEGFNVSTNGGGYTQTNRSSSGDQYVSFSWKAGDTAVSNTDGSITSTVSANTDAGFSIVKYTGNGNTAQQSYGHGLSQAPELVINKGIDALTLGTNGWAVGGTLLGNGGYMSLNNTNAKNTASSYNGNQVPNSSVVYISGTSDLVHNENNKNFISYCFTSITGYQKIGSYLGTGNTATNTISFGFEPRFVLIKRTDSTGGWRMYDGVRDSGNVPKRINHNLRAESNAAEYDGTPDPYGYMSFTSDGIEFSTNETNPDLNGLNGTYIYLAIA